MEQDQSQLLNHQLSRLRVKLLFAKLSVCSPEWRRSAYLPSYNQMYYIMEGEGSLRLDGKQYRPKPGELWFLPGGVEQAYSAADGIPYTMYWCHFRANVSFMRLFQWFGLPYAVPVAAEDIRQLQSGFRELADRRTGTGPATTLQVQAALFTLIGFFIDRAVMLLRRDPPPVAIGKLLDCLQYIEARLAQDLTVEQLSQHAHFHPNYFIRMFKRYMGLPPMRYIHERRMENAQQLLASTELQIGEVAQRSGFGDGSYFSAAFKKSTGLSPTDYRHLHGGAGKMNP
ncbi:AraC family transcriptional regulator [Paenibacillus doosanensis]|uniref:Arabinose operon regulatory protein n=1 Tax=Paenibacillus konkukensis TaxID=2020716 RepID=A0ABY4RWB8_9BACL|nr:MULTISPECIES: AraC family transcriptional regulator [Paenibacillus]MCS7458947.1 AraC family transcriptional regulator [Paenibacillus doosanensis]UQZ86523.1 Arabinose operon regulatory protein [Paenibacillus konkukensis]